MIRGCEGEDVSSHTLRIRTVAFFTPPLVVAFDHFLHASGGGAGGVPQLVRVTGGGVVSRWRGKGWWRGRGGWLIKREGTGRAVGQAVYHSLSESLGRGIDGGVRGGGIEREGKE